MESSEELDAVEVNVGVHVAGGIAYLGVCRGEALDLDDGADRVEASSQLDLDRRLDDFRARIGQEFRRLKPVAIGIARTRKFSQWRYADAFNRFSLEAMTMAAAVQEGFRCYLVVQEDAAMAVSAPVTRLAELMPDRLGIEPTAYWDKRALAFATALALAKGEARRVE